MLTHPDVTLQRLGHTPLIQCMFCVCYVGQCCVILFITITPLLQSMEGTCHGLVCIVVLGTHLVLLVLACTVVLGAHLVLSVLTALVICVCSMCVLWCMKRTCACCTWHMCWLCQCLLHLSFVLAIRMYCGTWSTPCAVCCTWHMCRQISSFKLLRSARA